MMTLGLYVALVLMGLTLGRAARDVIHDPDPTTRRINLLIAVVLAWCMVAIGSVL